MLVNFEAGLRQESSTASIKLTTPSSASSSQINCSSEHSNCGNVSRSNSLPIIHISKSTSENFSNSHQNKVRNEADRDGTGRFDF